MTDQSTDKVARERDLWFAENSAAQAALGRVREALAREQVGGCSDRHQQGETDECNACTAARIAEVLPRIRPGAES